MEWEPTQDGTSYKEDIQAGGFSYSELMDYERARCTEQYEGQTSAQYKDHHMKLEEAEELRIKAGFRSLPSTVLEGPHYAITKNDSLYPESLLRLEDPPETLFCIGDPTVLSEGLSIVGARKATPYGIRCAERFAYLAAERGIPIVSGGARGCDAAAHRSALAAGGRTVVVLGGGCHKIYPRSHYSLFQEVIDCGGVILSEQEWDFPPLRHTFRLRNRIIAALSRATLIVEAGLGSGTFSTADEALAVQREVLAVPGAISSATSRGANQLIYQGATPIISEEIFCDVIDGLYGTLWLKSIPTPRSFADEASPVARSILALVSAEPLSVEAVYESACERNQGVSLSDVVRILAELELAGLVRVFPNGYYGSVALLRQ